MQPQTIIIMGSSGSGKGTQAVLLKTYLEQQDAARQIIHVQAGKRFRELAASGSYTGGLVKHYIDEGKLAPEFLTIWAWSNKLVRNLGGNEHLIFDGNPRRPGEATMLEEAFQFYGREAVTVLFLSVSREWAEERLRERGRRDDLDTEDVKRRFEWYEKQVLPVIEFYKKEGRYHVLEINGEQSMESVQRDIVEALFG